MVVQLKIHPIEIQKIISTKAPWLWGSHELTPIPREMIQFDEHICQMGWNHQLECNSFICEAESSFHRPKSFNTPLASVREHVVDEWKHLSHRGFTSEFFDFSYVQL